MSTIVGILNEEIILFGESTMVTLLPRRDATPLIDEDVP